jgi:hypothetical protein
MIKSAAKSERTIRVNSMTDSISDMQSQAYQSHYGTGMDCRGDYMDKNDDVMTMGPPQKKPLILLFPPLDQIATPGAPSAVAMPVVLNKVNMLELVTSSWVNPTQPGVNR